MRAAQGLLLTTEAQQNASGQQLDKAASQAQLEAAQNLTIQLGDIAQNQHTNKPTPDKLDIDHLKNKEPYLQLHGQSGIAITTPQALAIATGKDFNQAAQRDTHQTSGRRWMHNVGESISLFVSGTSNKLKESIKLIAAKGNIQIQAQANDIEITADKKITITACKEKLTASAKKEFLFIAGDGYIKMQGGNIEIAAPKNLSMKAGSFEHVGAVSQTVAVPQMPKLREYIPFLLGNNVSAISGASTNTAAAMPPPEPVVIPKECSYLDPENELVTPPIQAFDKARRPATLSDPVETNKIFPEDTSVQPALQQSVKIGDKSILVTYPKGGAASDPATTLATPEQITKSLSILPDKTLNSISEVIISPNQNPFDSYWATEYQQPGFRSAATGGGNGVVTYYPSTFQQPQEDIDRIMAHEAGHTYSLSMWKNEASQKTAWENISKLDSASPSKYAGSSIDEDFSESHAMYIASKGTPCESTARLLYLNRYRALEKLYADQK